MSFDSKIKSILEVQYKNIQFKVTHLHKATTVVVEVNGVALTDADTYISFREDICRIVLISRLLLRYGKFIN